MAVYRDKNAPKGRVVFGGVAFHDGLTADINPGQPTLELFKSAGITEVATETPDEAPAEKPASRRSK